MEDLRMRRSWFAGGLRPGEDCDELLAWPAKA
jgi:hypothetical protein